MKYSEKTDKICELFMAGESLSEISSKLNIPRTGVYRALLKNNINTKRNNTAFRHKMRKYNINEDTFENIDTQEKAYMLGFMYADGNAHSKRKQISIKLQEKDKYILDRFMDILQTVRPLYFIKKQKLTHQNQYCMRISNTKLYDDLVGHGLVPRKTFITVFPWHIANEFYRHFVRGYFDGDGCISIDSSNNVGCINILGSTKFCQNLQDIFASLGVRSFISHDTRCKSGVDRIRIRKYSDVKTIYNWMYCDSSIHLDRKYDKFKKLMRIHNDNV